MQHLIALVPFALLSACNPQDNQTAGDASTPPNASPANGAGPATFAWAETIGSNGTSVSALAADSTGVVMVGALAGTAVINGKTYTSTNTTIGNAFMVKYDTTGKALWAVLDTNTGDQGSSLFRAVAIDPSGDIVVSASFTAAITIDGMSVNSPNNVQLGSMPQDQSQFLGGAVFKLSADGASVIWSDLIQSSVFAYADRLGVDSSGNVVISGWMAGVASFSNGAKTVSIAAGTTNGGTYLARYDSGGVLQWAEQAPSVPLGNQTAGTPPIAVDPGGAIYLGAGQESLDSTGGRQLTGGTILLLKYNADGSLASSASATGSGGASFAVTGITIDASGNAIIAGTIGASVLGQGGTQKAVFGTTTLSAQAGFAAEYDPTGTLKWATGIDNTMLLTGDAGRLFPAVSGASIYVFGDTDAGAAIFKLDASGVLSTGTAGLVTGGSPDAAAIAASGDSVYVAGVAQYPAVFGNIQIPGDGTSTVAFTAKLAL